MRWKTSSAKWAPFCPGEHELIVILYTIVKEIALYSKSVYLKLGRYSQKPHFIYWNSDTIWSPNCCGISVMESLWVNNHGVNIANSHHEMIYFTAKESRWKHKNLGTEQAEAVTIHLSGNRGAVLPIWSWSCHPHKVGQFNGYNHFCWYVLVKIKVSGMFIWDIVVTMCGRGSLNPEFYCPGTESSCSHVSEYSENKPDGQILI